MIKIVRILNSVIQTLASGVRFFLLVHKYQLVINELLFDPHRKSLYFKIGNRCHGK